MFLDREDLSEKTTLGRKCHRKWKQDMTQSEKRAFRVAEAARRAHTGMVQRRRRRRLSFGGKFLWGRAWKGGVLVPPHCLDSCLSCILSGQGSFQCN